MKSVLTTNTTPFVPQTISITLETKEELDMFLKLVGSPVTCSEGLATKYTTLKYNWFKFIDSFIDQSGYNKLSDYLESVK